MRLEISVPIFGSLNRKVQSTHRIFSRATQSPCCAEDVARRFAQRRFKEHAHTVIPGHPGEQANANSGTLQNGKVFVGDSGVVRLFILYAHLLLSNNPHTTHHIIREDFS